MKNYQFKVLVFLFVTLFMSTVLLAQDDKGKRPSPPAKATGKVGAATITIDYSSPSVKGRNVWDTKGTIAPYGVAWRAGANEATTFTTDKAIMVEGKSLPAGKYSLYAIPTEKEWTWVFNSKIPGWGIKKAPQGDGYVVDTDPSADVIKVMAKPVKSSKMNEKLTYEITSKGFVLRWENVEVPVSIK